MLRDSLSHAHEDMDARALREQQVEADRVVEALESALAADGEALLSADERAVIEAAMTKVRGTRQGGDHRAIRRAVDECNKASAEFAARRMNASIQKALSGRSLDELS
jgi:molecular chaperone HscA